jgi:hypothetical protein
VAIQEKHRGRQKLAGSMRRENGSVLLRLFWMFGLWSEGRVLKHNVYVIHPRFYVLIKE